MSYVNWAQLKAWHLSCWTGARESGSTEPCSVPTVSQPPWLCLCWCRWSTGLLGQVGKGNVTHAAWMGALKGGLKHARKYLEKVTQAFPALHALLPPWRFPAKSGMWPILQGLVTILLPLLTYGKCKSGAMHLHWSPVWSLLVASQAERSEPYLIWKLFWFDICKQFTCSISLALHIVNWELYFS